MANYFTNQEWDKIFTELAGKESKYQLPARDDNSLVLGSWNIRKFGEIDPKKRDDNHFKFITQTAGHFDLLAVQEVMDDLSSIRRLRDELNANANSPNEQYGLVLSDITGAIPGGEGMQERLAFLYRKDRILRTEIASDISVDRAPVMEFLKNQVGQYVSSLVDLIEDQESNRSDLLSWAREWIKTGKRKTAPKPPKLDFANFLTFVRSPYCVSFQLGYTSPNPYEVMAVAAHLVFGTPDQRKLEFEALVSWLSNRVVKKRRAYYPNFLLMGDLNLDIDSEPDRKTVDDWIKDVSKDVSDKSKDADIYLPFITPHPTPPHELIRSNVKLSQTYDQIGFFTTDPKFPRAVNRHQLGGNTSLLDYGVFNFTELFAQAILKQSYDSLNKKQKEALINRFQHTVSDHLPIWTRLKIPT
ncbi:endonuclease/exonuclease/phosphatase [bacterium]|nr:endonuclease/exonuclease/phosphatase [bacterium]